MYVCIFASGSTKITDANLVQVVATSTEAQIHLKTRAKPNNGENCYQTHIISLAFKLGFTQERVMGLVRVVVL